MKFIVLVGILILLLLLGVLTGGHGAQISIRQHPQAKNVKQTTEQPFEDVGQNQGFVGLTQLTPSEPGPGPEGPHQPGATNDPGFIPPDESRKPVPGPAGVVGLAAGWAWAKRLRRRLRRG